MANKSFDVDSLNGELLSDVEQPSLPSINDSILSDSDETPPEIDREAENCMDKRKSISLMDVSKIETFRTIPGKNLSWGTIGSSSSVGGRYSRDSGNQSWSLLSVASGSKLCEQHDVSGVLEECDRLKKELEYRDVMITTLQESNSELRVKCARAENKISELRLKCERKCNCCRPRMDPVGWKVSTVDSVYTPPVFPFLSEADSTRPGTPRPGSSLSPEVSSTSSSDPPPSPPHEQILYKVMKWQESQQEEKKLLAVSSAESMGHGFRSWGPGVSGGRSVASSPLQRTPRSSSTPIGSPALDNLSRLGVCVSARATLPAPSSSHSPTTSRLSASIISPRILTRLQPLESSYLTSQLVAQSPNRSVYDCLEKADMYAQELRRGLSRLPSQLESIRTIGKHYSPVNSH